MDAALVMKLKCRQKMILRTFSLGSDTATHSSTMTLSNAVICFWVGYIGIVVLNMWMKNGTAMTNPFSYSCNEAIKSQQGICSGTGFGSEQSLGVSVTGSVGVSEPDRPMVVSSGMQSMETMRRVYQTVKKHNQNFCILQCTSAYPLEAEDVNLRVITEYQKEFPDIPIGYSGHESGISISVAAVALGAKVLERHVTLDKSWKGSDHEASLVPAELAELVRAVRTVERALGSDIKRMLPCEKPCHDKLGKSVVAKKAIPKGTVISLDMLAVKVAEPKGVAPEDIFNLVGKRAKEDVEEDESITEEVIDDYGKRNKK